MLSISYIKSNFVCNYLKKTIFTTSIYYVIRYIKGTTSPNLNAKFIEKKTYVVKHCRRENVHNTDSNRFLLLKHYIQSWSLRRGQNKICNCLRDLRLIYIKRGRPLYLVSASLVKANTNKLGMIKIL